MRGLAPPYPAGLKACTTSDVTERIKMRRLLAVVVACTLSAAPLLEAAGGAQATASVAGTARSGAGQPMANSTVQLRNLTTGQLAGTTTSSSAGAFTFAGLPAGRYAVEVVNATGQIVGTSAALDVAAGAAISGVGVAAGAAAAAAAGTGAGLSTGVDHRDYRGRNRRGRGDLRSDAKRRQPVAVEALAARHRLSGLCRPLVRSFRARGHLNLNRTYLIPLLALMLVPIDVFAQADTGAPPTTTRLRFGPFYVNPVVALTNAGIDNNVFNEPDSDRAEAGFHDDRDPCGRHVAAIGPELAEREHQGGSRLFPDVLEPELREHQLQRELGDAVQPLDSQSRSGVFEHQ